MGKQGKTMQQKIDPYKTPATVTWVLAADNQHAEIMSCVKRTRLSGFVGMNKHHFPREAFAYELVPEPGGIIRSETLDDYQIGYDLRGTDMNSATAKRTTYEPEGNIQKELKRRYLKAIAEKLNRAALQDSFDKLVLVAPQRLIGEIKEHLPVDVLRRIVAEIPKDVMHASSHELLARLREVLAEKQCPHTET